VNRPTPKWPGKAFNHGHPGRGRREAIKLEEGDGDGEARERTGRSFKIAKKWEDGKKSFVAFKVVQAFDAMALLRGTRFYPLLRLFKGRDACCVFAALTGIPNVRSFF
jgi:hypothetical protein